MPLPFNEARVLKGLRFYIWKEGLKKAALSKVHVGQINLCLVLTDRFLVSSSWELCQKGGSQKYGPQINSSSIAWDLVRSQILEPHSRPAKSETLGVSPAIWVLISLPGDADSS